MPWIPHELDDNEEKLVKFNNFDSTTTSLIPLIYNNPKCLVFDHLTGDFIDLNETHFYQLCKMVLIPNIDLFDVTLSFWDEEPFKDKSFRVYSHPQIDTSRIDPRVDMSRRPIKYLEWAMKSFREQGLYRSYIVSDVQSYDFSSLECEFFGTKQEFIERYQQEFSDFRRSKLVLPMLIL